MKILNCLSLFHHNDSILELSESEKEDMKEFYKKYKRNFFIKKNTNNPKFVFHTVDTEYRMFNDGLPMIGINLHHRKTDTTEYKILVPKEKVIV